MNLNKCRLFLLLLIPFASFSQESGKMVLSLEEAETIFLRENLQLLAERLEISKAEAEKLQAKVWPNPNLDVDEVNLWTTDYQKRNGEPQPPLFGSESFGKFRQISAQISQLFETAGKRKKRMELSDVSSEMAQSYLKDFLLSLKTEFRKTVFSFHFHERYSAMLERQLTSLESIVNAYQHQYDAGNVNKAELIRLQASLFSIKDDLIEERKKQNKLTKELVVLLNIPDKTLLSFRDVYNTDYTYQLPFNYTLDFLQQQALLNRPDLAYSHLEIMHSQKELALEKAMAVPDVEFSIAYDRGGNILPDFIGFGAAIDLPFFDRNKGNIKKAELAVEQQTFLNQNKMLEVKEEVRQHYKNVLEAAGFFENINAKYTEDLDAVMNAYTEHFKLQSINIITYMDFLESYIDTKRTIFENQQEYLDDLEDLKYSTGIEIKTP